MPRQPQVEILPLALKSWRKERGQTQLDLARLAGCSEGLIAQIETGRRQPGLTNAVAIAHALDVPLAAIAHVYASAAILELAAATLAAETAEGVA